MEASADFTSVGRAWYHSGVLPAAMEDWISEAKPAAFVAASARIEAGSAVARARRADCCLHDVGKPSRAMRDVEATYSGLTLVGIWAHTAAARAAKTHDLNIILNEWGTI
jgi:hypothetical protein